ncbi:helix-turn-helix transcriptional regulator [Glaciimonas sp. GG7]
MNPRKKPIDKDIARQHRTELYEAINRGEVSVQNTIKKMRKIARLTQTEFAAHRGVSAKVIKEIERGIGNPTVNTLNRIGQFFGLEVAFVRSEKLRSPQGQITHALASPEASSLAQMTLALSPIAEARRLMEELENIKKLATPPKALQQALKTIESGLNVIREAQQAIGQTEELRHLASSHTELERAMQGLDTELYAVREAQNIIALAEKMQRQIQPPAALKQWLADLDAANKRLMPIDVSSQP